MTERTKSQRGKMRRQKGVRWELCWHETGDGPIPKILFYALGRIDPEECYRYTYAEARQKCVEFGHFGPWDGPHGCPPLEPTEC